MHPGRLLMTLVRYRAHEMRHYQGVIDVLRRLQQRSQPLRTSQYRTTVASASSYAHIECAADLPGQPIDRATRPDGRTSSLSAGPLVTLVVGKKEDRD